MAIDEAEIDRLAALLRSSCAAFCARPPAPPPKPPKPHWAFQAIGIATILGLCYWGELVLAVMLVSVLLAFILAPVMEFFILLHLPRGLAAAVAVILLFTLLTGLVYYSSNQAIIFVQDLSKYTQTIRQEITQVRLRAESLGSTEPAGQIKAEPRSSTNWEDVLTRGFGSVSQALLAASFVPFLVYFMLSWQHHVRSATVMLFSLENRNTAYITLGLISAMIRSFMVGNLLIGLFLGTVSTIAFAILHVPFFYFIGFISGFLSLVPYLGVVLAMAPADLRQPGTHEFGRRDRHYDDGAGSAPGRAQRALPQVPGQPPAVEPAGSNHGAAGLGMAMGRHGPGSCGPHHCRHEDRLRPHRVAEAVRGLDGGVAVVGRQSSVVSLANQNLTQRSCPTILFVHRSQTWPRPICYKHTAGRALK